MTAKLTKSNLKAPAAGILPPTQENIALTHSFLLEKWKQRSAEKGHKTPPSDLTDACKFVSRFAQLVFGGEMQGNWHHQFTLLPNQSILDLTDLDCTRYKNLRYHDTTFWGNRDHRDSMSSIEPRVQSWVPEFIFCFAPEAAIKL